MERDCDLNITVHQKGRRPKPTPLEVSPNPRPGVMKISVPPEVLITA